MLKNLLLMGLAVFVNCLTCSSADQRQAEAGRRVVIERVSTFSDARSNNLVKNGLPLLSDEFLTAAASGGNYSESPVNLELFDNKNFDNEEFSLEQILLRIVNDGVFSESPVRISGDDLLPSRSLSKSRSFSKSTVKKRSSSHDEDPDYDAGAKKTSKKQTAKEKGNKVLRGRAGYLFLPSETLASAVREDEVTSSSTTTTKFVNFPTSASISQTKGEVEKIDRAPQEESAREAALALISMSAPYAPSHDKATARLTDRSTIFFQKRDYLEAGNKRDSCDYENFNLCRSNSSKLAS